MPLLYIAIFIHFLSAVNADNTNRGFTNFHSRTGDFTGFWTESSDDCRNFTKRSIKEGLKMAQGHFTRRGKYGGFYCFPISRMLSRIGPFETEIIDDKNNYRWVFSIKNNFDTYESWVNFLTLVLVIISSRLFYQKTVLPEKVLFSSDLETELHPAFIANASKKPQILNTMSIIRSPEYVQFSIIRYYMWVKRPAIYISTVNITVNIIVTRPWMNYCFVICANPYFEQG